MGHARDDADEDLVAPDAQPDRDGIDADVRTALEALVRLGRPSTSADRSRLWKENSLPRGIGALLGRARVIAPPAGSDGGAHVVRIVTDKGRKWLQNPALIFEEIDAASGYIAAIHKALGNFAEAESLPVGTSGHILRTKAIWLENLWRPLHEHRAAFPADSDLHRWVHHLRSSQAFAFNLFGPLAVGMAWAKEIWRPVFGEVRSIRFEYPIDGDPDGDDPLGERTIERPHRTRIDVRVDHGANEVTLIEVKLTEPEFGGCSASRKDENDLRETCRAGGLSLEQRAAGCYLVQRAGRSYFRRLTEAAAFVSTAGLMSHSATGCPLRNGAYQIVRNLLIAQSVRARGHAVRFMVVAPGPTLNPSLHGARSLHGHRDAESFLRSIARPEDHTQIAFLDFTTVVGQTASPANEDHAEWSSYMRRKYVEPLTRGTAKDRTPALPA